MAEHVLVSGGAGFIGSHVASQYLESGHHVTVLDDLSSGRREHIPDGADFVHADICSPEARAVMAERGVTVLNHHAAQMDVRVSVRNPELDARINVMGLLNLLEGGRAGTLRRVVFASSGGVVYGEGDALPYPEGAPKLPVSPYGVTKLASEYYLCAYSVLHGLETVALRYANVYGPRQSPHGEAGVVAIFSDRLRNGKPLTVYGDGEQTRDYVYVEDVARANVLGTASPIAAPTSIDDLAYNIGTGRETSVNRLVDTLFAATGLRVDVERAPARPGELQRNAVQWDRAGAEWGWRPEVSLEVGLERTYRWLAEAAA